MSFVHLHVHSHYSLLDGLSKVPELVGRAKEYNLPALALTDHGVMYGLMEFYQQAQQAGIKPILGVEAYLARHGHRSKQTSEDGRPFHLILLARNATGYQNLIKLTTIAHLDGFYYKPRIDHELLEEYGEGLIALTACLNGEVPWHLLNGGLDQASAALERYIKIFGEENVYLEVQHHPTLPKQQEVNDGIFALHAKYGLPVVATVDSHYLDRSDDLAQDVMLCIQTKKTLADTDRMSYVGEDFSLQSPDRMAEIWADHPEVLTNTLKVADRCEVEIEFGKTMLPSFALPAGQTAEGYLSDLCAVGLERRYGKEIPPIVRERLKYELEVIEKTGFASYFLIVQDFINWAKDRGIVVGPGRGSAAGSLVAFLTRITNIDPLTYDLIFERFLNPERISMPDIDTDFADHRRDEVLSYVSQKYGSDHVAQIITFGTMAARAAVRDVGRVLGLPYAFCDRVAKLIPMFATLDQAIEGIPELQAVQNESDGKRLLEIARRLEGCVRHASTHACGVVITPVPMDQIVPRQRSGVDEEEIITQYEMHAVEGLGLLKMDFLGLKNLTLIENTLELLSIARGVTIDLEALPLDDQKSFELLQRGETTGVFQLESSGMRRYLRQLMPTELEDIIVMVSLYRPGPMEFIPDYIAGKHGKRRVTYLDKGLKPILEKTYGIAIYQEQIMQIARDLAGFSYSEADVLRKAVGKKIASLLKQQQDKMIRGMVSRGIAQAIAKQIWDFILPFARYGFNRSHAACYALIAYQTAYLKSNYPAEFMASLMTTDHGDVDRIAIEVDECRQMGLEVLPPAINESFSTFTVVYDSLEQRADKVSNTIRFGLSAVKNLGENVIKAIIKERKENGPFQSLEDFLSRVKTKDLNKKSLEALIKTGCMDQFGERNFLLGNMDRLLTFVRSLSEESETKQGNLFGMLPSQAVLARLTLEPMPESTDQQRLRWEKELLGLYVSSHPLAEYKDLLSGRTTAIAEVSGQVVSSDPLLVAGVITKVKRVITKNGEQMVFVRLEDVSGGIEVLVFPRTYQADPAVWVEDRIIAMNCRLSDKDGEHKIICKVARELVLERAIATLEDLRRFVDEKYSANGWRSRRQPSVASEPVVQTPVGGSAQIVLHQPPDGQLADQLKAIFRDHPGDHQACLVIKSPTGNRKLLTEYKIAGGDDVQRAIESLLGANSFYLDLKR